MSLLGLPFLVGVCAAAVAVPAAAWVLWQRWPKPLAVPGRALSLLLVMAMGALLSATLVNRSFGFYASLSEILATSARTYQPPPSFGVPASRTRLVVLTPHWQELARKQAAFGRGVLLDVVFGGARSGISRHGLVYLPATYAFGGTQDRLPVLELFNGYPGTPHNFTDQLAIGAVLDTEIMARRIPPMILVIPTTYAGRVSQCVDAVHGQRNETYLAVDVPADVQEAFRVLPGRSFAALGYSEGGFCAVNLALHHPDRYAAAASMSGFFHAGMDPGSRALYGRGGAAVDRNSPLWWVAHRAPTGPALYLVASRQDPDAARQDAQMLAAARANARRLPIAVAQLPAGGHNFATWSLALPATLDYLGHYLPMPLAPPLLLPMLPEPSGPPLAAAGPASPDRPGGQRGRAPG
jgi:S-formylglutathione hydrolase FrmB